MNPAKVIEELDEIRALALASSQNALRAAERAQGLINALAPEPAEAIPWCQILRPTTGAAEIFPKATDVMGNESWLDYVLRIMRVWWLAGVRTIIIEVTPDGIDTVLPYLMVRKPEGMTIVPAIPTCRVLCNVGRRFSSGGGWAEIDDLAKRMRGITGQDTVLLDNETALLGWHQGAVPDFNMEALRQSLSGLTGKLILYLPEVLGNHTGFSAAFENASREDRTAELVETFAGALGPRVKFLESNRGREGWETRPEAMRLYDRMRGIVGDDRLIRRMGVTPLAAGYRRHYSVGGAVAEAAAMPRGTTVQPWTSGGNLVTVAEQWAEAVESSAGGG